MSDDDCRLVESHLRAMQRGPGGEDAIADLFTDDGVYVESLTAGDGSARTHAGREAIRQALRSGLAWNPPDLRVTLDRLEIDGDRLVARWTCTSARLPGPMRGTDRYSLRGGRIARLETRLD